MNKHKQKQVTTFLLTAIVIAVLSSILLFSGHEIQYSADVTPPFCDGKSAVGNSIATMILNRTDEQGDLLDIDFNGFVTEKDAQLVASLPCLRKIEDKELFILGLNRSMDMVIRSLWHKTNEQGYHIALDQNGNGEIDVADATAILAALSAGWDLEALGISYNLIEPSTDDIGQAYADWIISTKDANNKYYAWYWFDLDGSGIDPATGKYTVDDLDVEAARNIGTLSTTQFHLAYKKIWPRIYGNIGRNIGDEKYVTYLDFNNDGRNDQYDYKVSYKALKGDRTGTFRDYLSLPEALPAGSLVAETGQTDVIIGEGILPAVQDRMILYFGMNGAFTTANPRGLNWGIQNPARNGWYSFLEQYGATIIEWGNVWVHNPAGAKNFNRPEEDGTMQLSQIPDAIRENNKGGTTFEGAWKQFLDQNPSLKETSYFYVGACRLDSECFTYPVGCTDESCRDLQGTITDTTDKKSIDDALNFYLSAIAPILRLGVTHLMFDTNAGSVENSVDYIMAELLSTPTLRNTDDPTNPYRQYTEVINEMKAIIGNRAIAVGVEAKPKASHPHWGGKQYMLTLLDSFWNGSLEYDSLFLRNTEYTKQFRIATTENPAMNDFSQTTDILQKGFYSVLSPATTMVATRNIYGVTGKSNLAPLIAAKIPALNNQMKLYGTFSSNYFTSYHIITPPKYGSLKRSQDYDNSVFVYTPNYACSPLDGFDYRISDGTNGSKIAHYSIAPSCQVECFTNAECVSNQVCVANKCENTHLVPIKSSSPFSAASSLNPKSKKPKMSPIGGQ